MCRVRRRARNSSSGQGLVEASLRCCRTRSARIAVSDAKHCHLQKGCYGCATSERRQLALQVAAKNEFLRDTGAD
jgi:hypothetical protein